MKISENAHPAVRRFAQFFENLIQEGIGQAPHRYVPSLAAFARELNRKGFRYKKGQSIGQWRNGASVPEPKIIDAVLEVIFGKDLNDPKRNQLFILWKAAQYRDMAEDEVVIEGQSGQQTVAVRDRDKDPVVQAPLNNLGDRRPPGCFTGRAEELAQIREIFDRGSTYLRPVAVAAHGMRGVGKTSLAAAYAHESLKRYRAVWWIDAQEVESIAAGLSELGVFLSWVRKSEPVHSNARSTLNRLSVDAEPILLIFDNAMNVEMLSPWLPRTGVTHSLITSTAWSWRALATSLELLPWDSEVGASYLLARTGWDRWTDDAKKLSNEMEGLPLALEMAAAYCEETDTSFSDYLNLFKKTPARLLKDKFHVASEYRGGQTVEKAFSLTLDKVAKESQAAVQFLLYASYLPVAPPIPFCLFDRATKEFTQPLGCELSSKGARHIAAILRSFGLIRFTRWMLFDQSASSNAFAIHRLIRALAKEYSAEVTNSDPTNMMARVIVASFKDCDFFEAEPPHGTGHYNVMYSYVTHAGAQQGFGSRLSQASKEALINAISTHDQLFNAWPH